MSKNLTWVSRHQLNESEQQWLNPNVDLGDDVFYYQHGFKRPGRGPLVYFVFGLSLLSLIVFATILFSNATHSSMVLWVGVAVMLASLLALFFYSRGFRQKSRSYRTGLFLTNNHMIISKAGIICRVNREDVQYFQLRQESGTTSDPENASYAIDVYWLIDDTEYQSQVASVSYLSPLDEKLNRWIGSGELPSGI